MSEYFLLEGPSSNVPWGKVLIFMVQRMFSCFLFEASLGQSVTTGVCV